MAGPIVGYGFSTVQGRDLAGLDADLARISGAGAGWAELSLFAMDVVTGGRPIRQRVQALERLTGRHRLRYTAHGPMAVNLMEPEHEALFKRTVEGYLEVCGAVGASVLVLHTGIVRHEAQGALDRRHGRERSALRHLGDVAGRHGVTIAVETVFAFGADRYTAAPSRLAREIEAVEHPHVTGCLDISHARLQCAQAGLDFEAELAAFAPVTGHIHIHDSFGLPETVRGFGPSETLAFGLGDVHLPLGWGDIPFTRILPTLGVRAGTVAVCELPPHFLGETAACGETLAGWLPLVGARAV